jgi:COMPASS component SWD1
MSHFSDPLLRNTLPQTVEDTLEDGSGNRVTSLGFNRKGCYLAAGHHDGRVTVWDFDTRSVARVFIGHVRPITSVSWSRSSRYLATASLDWLVRVWDITTSAYFYTHTFKSMVFKAVFHPTLPLILVSLWMDSPHLINVETKEVFILKEEKEWDDAEESTIQITAEWNLLGDLMYLGGSDGTLVILSTETRAVVHSFIVDGGPQSGKVGIKSIGFSRDGRQYILNSMDRAIRIYNVDDNSFSMKLCVTVDQFQWKVSHFYGDDYVISCSSETSSHKIHIWNRHFGQLVTILEGFGKHTILDMIHHPTRPLFVLSATDGSIFIWGKRHTESWSAYAPGFTELEENEEYVEREDEFDEVPDPLNQVKNDVNDDKNVEIDMASDGEEEDFYFPVIPIHDGDMVSSSQPLPATTKSKGKPNLNRNQ